MTSRSGSRPGEATSGLLGQIVSLLVLSLGILVGLAVGAGVYLLLHPGTDGFMTVLSTMDLAVLAYPVIGGLAGILVSYAVLGVGWVRRTGRAFLGIYGGAMAGLLIYVFGYVAANHAAVSSAGGYLALAAAGALSGTVWELVAVFLGALLGLLVVRYAWRFEGLLAFVSLATVVAGYIGYSLFVTLPQVPVQALPLSILLFICETMALSFVLIYAFYPMDVVQRTRWSRKEEQRAFSPYYEPKVAFQVPTFNEPPGMVIETIKSLMDVDYPEDRYIIMVLDDSTEEQYRAPVREFCEENDVFYMHREDRHGYKAGALNDALPHTPPDVELLAVIDADYQVSPDYLRNTVGYFVKPEVAFLQTPQNYRNADVSFLTKNYQYADAYFYHTVLPSRNESNAIIFCGTMGILRRRSLEKVGGWSEDHVTEDAELAARLLDAGYDSVYVSQYYGNGLIPEDFGAYKKQQNRWAFGGGQVLRTHFNGIVASKQLTTRQKFDYISGIVHWFDGIFLVAIALILMALGLGDLVGSEVVTHHQAEVWLVGLIPLFLLVEAVLRVRMSLNRIYDLSTWETLQVFGMWFSAKFSNTWASLRGLFGEEQPFVRTPKGVDEDVGRLDALKRSVQLNPFETAMAAGLVIVSLGVFYRMFAGWAASGAVDLTRLLFVVWLGLYATVFLCPPLYAYKSYRSVATDDDPSTPAVDEPPATPSADVEDQTPWAKDPWRAGILVSIFILALALRLKDPLMHTIIGAEDPYIHMERTWDLIQHGQLPEDYPPGFAALLAPLAMLGPDMFYWLARLAPPFLGVVEVAGIYLLLHGRVRETGALVGAFTAAVMPENIFRTNLLFPTALDLALLPFLFLFLLRYVEGDQRSLWGILGIGAVLLMIHPWLVGLALPPLTLWLLLQASPEWRTRLTLGAAVTGILLLVVLSNMPGTWNPIPQMLANVGATMDRILAQPGSLLDLPRYVDLANMLTPAVLVVGALGSLVAATRRTPLDQLALLWTFLLLPLALVNWFDIWFLPHRVVAYLTLGAAILTGIAAHGAYDLLPDRRSVRGPTLTATLLIFLALTAPAGATTQDWYRLYDEDDYGAWQDVAAEEPSLVVAGSWQTRAGYRAITGQDAQFNTAFFNDTTVRDQLLQRHPDLVVIVGHHSEKSGVQTGFLSSGNWTTVAETGDVQAYRQAR